MPLLDDDRHHRHHRHDCYVAGRYRDGSVSDEWTDVERCAGGTFRAYLPRCTCGWAGRQHPATAAGAAECRREWFLGHLVATPVAEPA